MFGMTPNTRARMYGDVASALLLGLLTQTAFSLLAAAIPLLAPAVVAERGWNVTIIALYPTVVYVTAFLFSFQVPELIFRTGGMRLSLVCVAGAAMGLMFLLLPCAAAAVLTSIAIGCGTGAINPASAQVLEPRTTARTAGLVMSIKQTGVPLGGVLAGALVPVLTARAGWHVAALAFGVMGGLLVAVLLPSVRWLNSAGAAAKPAAFRPLDPITDLLVMPGLPALLLASLTFNGMQVCLRSFFTVYLVTDQRLSLVSAGLVFSISQAAGMIGQVGWAALSDRLLSVRAVMAVIGTLMSAAAFCTAAMTPDWPIGTTAIVAAIYGVSAAGYLPVLLGEVARRAPPGQIGALTSGAQLFPLAGCILGPLAFGGMAAILGMPAAFVLAGATTLAGAVILGAPDRLFAEWIAIEAVKAGRWPASADVTPALRTMNQFGFRQVDVFTSQPFSGNPLAVVLRADTMSDADMAALANWTNLSETAFLLRPTHPLADYRVRIFTPREELPFAGHPTLGSCHVWLASGTRPKGREVIQECGIGLVRVRSRLGLVSFAAPELRRSGTLDADLLAHVSKALHLSPHAIVASNWVDNGPGWLAILLGSRDEVLAICPDYTVLSGLRVGIVGLWDASKDGNEAQFEVRAFTAGGYEDPVTGSLNAGLAQWLISSGVAPSSYVVSQGTALGRRGRIFVERNESGTWIGGVVTACITGSLTL